jgi:MtaA/CmuA family methyltransferase
VVLMHTMNSLERAEKVLQHQLPDRPPVDLPNFLVTARLMGATSYADFFRDGEAMAEGQLLAWRKYGHDVLTLENGTAALAEACGVQVVYQSESAPVAKAPAIRSLEEVDQLKLPDPYHDPLLKELLKTTRIVAKETHGKACIKGRADQGPFSLACEIRGMAEFMMDLMSNEQPEQILKLLDYCRKASFIYACAQIEQGAHITSIGESPSGPDMLSPRLYRKFAWPQVRQLASDLKDKGVRVSYHICGNATPILPDMVNTGVSMIEIDQKADMGVAKAEAQGKIIIIGTVDPSGVMANGTLEQVREKCREAIQVLGRAGGFFLAPGCALPATTPDENIAAMIETAKSNPYTHS